MDQRDEQYRNLRNFTKETHKKIVKTISSLGWTKQSIESDSDNRLLCPYNSSHRIGKDILDRHLESCQWKQEGYSEFDVQLPESGSSLNSYTSLKLDSTMQNNILLEAKKKDPDIKIGLGERLIPQTSNRIFTDFTKDERRVLYDYVVSNTVKPDIGHDIANIQEQKTEEKEDKQLSYLELLIQERNLKRRRAKHKGVHTNKKSHTEIIREVIHQQMEVYTDCITETQTSNHNAEHTITSEDMYADRNLEYNREIAMPSFSEYSSRPHNSLVENPSEIYENSYSFEYERYKSFDRSYDVNTEAPEHREYPQFTTDPLSTHKSRKHKKSRLRERDHDEKGKRKSKKTHHKKKEHKVKRRRQSSG